MTKTVVLSKGHLGWRPIAAISAGASLIFLVQSAVMAVSTPPDISECASQSNIQNKAMNCPNQFAWETFVKINQPTPSGNPAWHDFALDQETFPGTPVPSVCGTPDENAKYCPTWPNAGRPLPIEQHGSSKSSHKPVPLPVNARLTPFLNNIEIVHRNKPSFDYIVAHDLWYQQGLAKTFETNFEVDFPIAAIELKTNWIDLSQIAPEKRSTYYSVEYKGKVMGLAAMHLTTKDLPKWFWATFEHVDNPGRCDWLDCRDSFGVSPSITKAKEPLYGPYVAETIKPALAEMLETINPVFRNYRLKGSQVDFVDDAGNDQLLGNSVTEFSFIQNSSCMTCHSRAAVNWQGQNGFGGFGNTPGDQIISAGGLPTAGISAPQQSFSGPPDPRWFEGAGGNRQLQTMDFLWAMPFKAQLAVESVPPSSSE